MTRQKTTGTSGASAKKPRTAPGYSSKIIKASALLDDTKALLAQWDAALSVSQNMQRVRQDNLIGKASRSRVGDILAIFRQRYLAEPAVTKALVALVRNRFPAASLDRILYFHSARADALLRDTVTEVLVPLHALGRNDIAVADIEGPIARWVEDGRATSRWSEETVRRVVQGLMATLRDFGVLEGAVHKRIAPSYLPVEAFAYVAFYLKQHQPSGARLIDARDWKLFFLSREGVERFFLDAHQHGLLGYQAAGSIVRINFASATLEEYASAIAQRAH